MLNKAPNNKDVVCIVNIMLNEASNSNDAMDLANNVCLTIMGAQQFLMAVIQSSCRKVNLPEMRDNDTKRERFMQTKNKLRPGKEWRLYGQ